MAEGPQNVALRSNNSVLTPELSDRLVTAIKKVPTFTGACRSCDCTPSTVRAWLQAGQMYGADPLLADFSTRFLAADARFQNKLSAIALDPFSKAAGNNAVKLLEMRLKDGISTLAEPDPMADAEAWLESGDQQMIEMIQGSSVVPLLLDAATLARDDVRAALTEAGWLPPPQ